MTCSWRSPLSCLEDTQGALSRDPQRETATSRTNLLPGKCIDLAPPAPGRPSSVLLLRPGCRLRRHGTTTQEHTAKPPQIPDLQKLRETRSACYCFKPLHFEVIGCAATDQQIPWCSLLLIIEPLVESKQMGPVSFRLYKYPLCLLNLTIGYFWK